MLDSNRRAEPPLSWDVSWHGHKVQTTMREFTHVLSIREQSVDPKATRVVHGVVLDHSKYLKAIGTVLERLVAEETLQLGCVLFIYRLVGVEEHEPVGICHL